MNVMLKKKFKYLAYASLSVFLFSLNRCSSSTEETAKMIQVPFSLTYQPSATKLTEDASLELAPTVPTNIQLYIANCSSGYTDLITLSTATVGLFTSDKNCLVRLISFTLGSTIYSVSGVNVVNFSTWLANDTATFQSTTLATDVIKVFCIAQVTQAGVTGSDTISYKFTDIQSLTTSSLAQANITYSNSVSVTGDPAPNVTMLQARVLSGNANGSFNMSFTLQCGASVTGSTPTYQCSGVQMNTRFDYILVMDTYSQSALTVAQLTAAFAANTPTTVGSLVVGNGGSDLNSNVLSTGGFYTSNASPLVTGTTGVYTGNPNMVFMLRQKDATVTNVQSFTYFYVDLPADTSSGCGTTFTAGAGTSTNPYLISTATDLVNTVNCTSSSVYFIQVQDIDLTSVSWTPINMYGQYNGNNYSISNLSYTNAGTASAVDGLFSTIQTGASVSYLTLTNITITSVGASVGGLAGVSAGTITGVNLTSGTITNTYSQAAAGTDNFGGLIGNMSGGSITTSGSSASVVGVSSSANTGTFNIGGLVGLSTAPSISSSYATGDISISTASTTAKTINMGNFIGAVTSGTAAITQNYATGNITFPTGGTNTTLRMGSVAQFAPTSGSLSASFAKGTYTASSALTMTIGGMVGALTSPATINNSYTMVTFSTTGQTAGNLGGFVGTSSAASLVSSSYSADPSFSSTITTKRAFNGSSNAVSLSYYYSGATGVPTETSGALALSTQTAMQTITNYTGFAFGTSSTNWMMPTASTFSSPSGFLSPVFYWQCGTNGIACDTTYNSPTIANGSFESGTYGGTAGNFQTLAPGSTNITSWTISANSIDWINAPYWQASNGSFSLDLNGGGPSSISQTLATTSGATYLVNFDLAGNYACTPAIKTITVSAASNSTNYSFNTTGKSAGNMGYVLNNFVFIATSSSTTLTFTSTTTGICGPALDNVR